MAVFAIGIMLCVDLDCGGLLTPDLYLPLPAQALNTTNVDPT